MRYIIFILALLLIILVIIFPETSRTNASEAARTWFNMLVPCLMPYCIACNILVKTGILNSLSKPLYKATKKTFGFSGSFSYVFLTSLLSGYPNGANLCGELYHIGALTANEAGAMINASSLCGPSFIISAVASGMFGDISLAKYIFIPHLISALIIAIINGKSQESENLPLIKSISSNMNSWQVITDSVANASLSMLNILGFTVILTVVSGLIAYIFKDFFSSHQLVYALFTGIIEMTKGCRLSSRLGIIPALIIISFCVSFGGISVICQTASTAMRYNLKTKHLVLSKFVQGVLSATLTYLYITIFPL